MKRINLIFPLIALVLTSCADGPKVKPVTLPSGSSGYFVTCDLSGHDWTECYDAAHKVCKGPYEISDKSESSTPTPYGPLVRRSMFVKCNQ